MQLCIDWMDACMDGWMDGGTDILETGPGVVSDALLVQPVVTQIQLSQPEAALQHLLRHLLDLVLTHL